MCKWMTLASSLTNHTRGCVTTTLLIDKLDVVYAYQVRGTVYSISNAVMCCLERLQLIILHDAVLGLIGKSASVSLILGFLSKPTIYSKIYIADNGFTICQFTVTSITRAHVYFNRKTDLIEPLSTDKAIATSIWLFFALWRWRFLFDDLIFELIT